ncbi:pyridoxal phosphate-dependent transferase [Boeremia exigua]|uniref:pyridoxal phosphate-dependent transferase n=1 Tax=Boeremia exigua TaxID=749465 RepID=UPI001E8E6830|nr:pyridoxal phosphate-dependent transferase [Boeremia exigua]KAH6642721.1 pyridoxal phosphate-dependent transferase [Boeremia exigua]
MDSNTSPRLVLIAHVNKMIEKYTLDNPLSLQAHKKACNALPGGQTRSVLSSSPFPLTIRSARRVTVTSLDGRDYLDMVSDYSAGLYGHSHPIIKQSIMKALDFGFSIGGITETEYELSDILKQRFPSIDLVRFCNSGTEANTYAIAAALAFTGRKKVLIFDHGYHGGSLSFGSEGNAMNLPHDFVFGTYNNVEKTKAVVDKDIGVILVEPMQSAGGLRMATREFMQFLRGVADTVGALLVLDEVVTSRLHFNGLQSHFGVKPDLTTLGKYIGGGLPFGAFGGRSDVMRQFDLTSTDSGPKLNHSGTFNNNIFTMTAAVAAANLVSNEEIERLNRLGDALRNGAVKLAKAARLDHINIIGYGSAIGFELLDGSGKVWKDLLYFYFLERGIMIGRRGFLFLNLVHVEGDVDSFLRVFQSFTRDFGSKTQA